MKELVEWVTKIEFRGLSCDPVIFKKILKGSTWSETAVQIRRFLNLWEFFKNHEITWETSDFDFCDLLDELFHMAKKVFSKKKKSNYQKLF